MGLVVMALVSIGIRCSSPSETCHTFEGSIGGELLNKSPLVLHNRTQCETKCLETENCYGYTYASYGSPSRTAERTAEETALLLPPNCTLYNASNIGGGENMPGTPTMEPSTGACCELCASTPECLTWTWVSESVGEDEVVRISS